MIDFREIQDGETWELFARDLLHALGFSIEQGPDRGPDMGRDMLVLEDLKGRVGTCRFRWLVSCKHNAQGQQARAVNEDDEPNIQERLSSLNADGFLGVYSTVASTNLNKRLGLLRDNRRIGDYRILDHKLIENYLVRLGYSFLVMRYFPQSYRALKPLHAMWGEYQSLECAVCGKDLLEDMSRRKDMSLVLQVDSAAANGKECTNAVLWACKGACEGGLSARLAQQGLASGWMGLSDLAIPTVYLNRILTIMRRLQAGHTYSEEAFACEKHLLMALGQRVFRELTEDERREANQTLKLLEWGF